MTTTKDVVKQYHDGKRWSLFEKQLTQEEEQILQKNKLDYRDMESFIYSKQVHNYIEKFGNTLLIDWSYEDYYETYLENNTNFEWSNPVSKSCEFIQEDIPTGADPLLFLCFKMKYKINLRSFDPHESIYPYRYRAGFEYPIVNNVYLHGEDIPFYEYDLVNPYRNPYDISKVTMYEFASYQPILNILALTGDMSFCSHKWSDNAINEAIKMVKQELEVIELDKEFYKYYKSGKNKNEKSSILSTSLIKLEEMLYE